MNNNSNNISQAWAAVLETKSASDYDAANFIMQLYPNLYYNKDTFIYWNEDTLLWESIGTKSKDSYYSFLVLRFIEPIRERIEMTKKQLTELHNKNQIAEANVTLGKLQDFLYVVKLTPFIGKVKKPLVGLLETRTAKQQSLPDPDNQNIKINSSIISLFDTQKYTIPLQGGYLINVKTLQVRKRVWYDYYTREFPIPVPTGISKDWINETADIQSLFCELIDSDPNGNKVRYLQRVLGYCLTGDISAKKFFVLYSNSPDTGKSLVLNMMLQLMSAAEYNATSWASPCEVRLVCKLPGQSAHTAELMQVKNRRLITLSEAPDSPVLNADNVKRLTGDRSMAGRDVCKSSETFTHYAKLLCALNTLFVCNQGSAEAERIIYLLFNIRFVSDGYIDAKRNYIYRIPKTPEDLNTESTEIVKTESGEEREMKVMWIDGVNCSLRDNTLEERIRTTEFKNKFFKWLLLGLKELYTDFDKMIQPPPEYKMNMNVNNVSTGYFNEWYTAIVSHIKPSATKNKLCPKEEAYRNYVDWLHYYYPKKTPISDKTFNAQMSSILPLYDVSKNKVIVKSNESVSGGKGNKPCWVNIKLKTLEDVINDEEKGRNKNKKKDDSVGEKQDGEKQEKQEEKQEEQEEQDVPVQKKDIQSLFDQIKKKQERVTSATNSVVSEKQDINEVPVLPTQTDNIIDNATEEEAFKLLYNTMFQAATEKNDTVNRLVSMCVDFIDRLPKEYCNAIGTIALMKCKGLYGKSIKNHYKFKQPFPTAIAAPGISGNYLGRNSMINHFEYLKTLGITRRQYIENTGLGKYDESTGKMVIDPVALKLYWSQIQALQNTDIQKWKMEDDVKILSPELYEHLVSNEYMGIVDPIHINDEPGTYAPSFCTRSIHAFEPEECRHSNRNHRLAKEKEEELMENIRAIEREEEIKRINEMKKIKEAERKKKQEEIEAERQRRRELKYELGYDDDDDEDSDDDDVFEDSYESEDEEDPNEVISEITKTKIIDGVQREMTYQKLRCGKTKIIPMQL
jgi:phage/plasmid-associated DNA primase